MSATISVVLQGSSRRLFEDSKHSSAKRCATYPFTLARIHHTLTVRYIRHVCAMSLTHDSPQPTPRAREAEPEELAFEVCTTKDKWPGLRVGGGVRATVRVRVRGRGRGRVRVWTVYERGRMGTPSLAILFESIALHCIASHCIVLYCIVFSSPPPPSHLRHHDVLMRLRMALLSRAGDAGYYARRYSRRPRDWPACREPLTTRRR